MLWRDWLEWTWMHSLQFCLSHWSWKFIYCRKDNYNKDVTQNRVRTLYFFYLIKYWLYKETVWTTVNVVLNKTYILRCVPTEYIMNYFLKKSSNERHVKSRCYAGSLSSKVKFTQQLLVWTPGIRFHHLIISEMNIQMFIISILDSCTWSIM